MQITLQEARISHIGSTAINGIWAKPTVDILIEIPRNGDRDEVKKALIHNGYGCMSEDAKRMLFNKGYTDAKGGFVRECTQRAKKEYNSRYNLK